MKDLKTKPEVLVATRDPDLAMLDQQLALGAYLQALLTPPVDPPAVDTVAPAPEVVEEIRPVEPAIDLEMPAPDEPIDVADVHPETALVTPPVAPPDIHPDWAQGSFQCLLFRVGGISLAIPLVKLSGVLPWDDAAVTEMPGHSPWFLGLREHLGHKVKLIDVANVVLPQDRFSELAAPDSNRLGKVILIDDGRWGLAVDEVDVVVTLSAEAVKWRGRSGTRPWLAGTVIKHMCALIDTDAFAAMLASEGPRTR